MPGEISKSLVQLEGCSVINVFIKGCLEMCCLHERPRALKRYLNANKTLETVTRRSEILFHVVFNNVDFLCYGFTTVKLLKKM